MAESACEHPFDAALPLPLHLQLGRHPRQQGNPAGHKNGGRSERSEHRTRQAEGGVKRQRRRPNYIGPFTASQTISDRQDRTT